MSGDPSPLSVSVALAPSLPSALPLSSASPAAEPISLAAPLTLALRAPSPLAPSRDDAWSDGATSTLIDAWGDRYLELNRGNLKQKQWQEVADAVTSRDGYTKTPKTDVQCKNRIDTLKKKYKSEKSKIGSSSPWPYFNRLDRLLGPTLKPPPQAQSTRTPPLAGIRPGSGSGSGLPQFPQRHRSNHPAFRMAKPSSPPSGSLSSGDSSDGLPPSGAVNGKRARREDEEDDEEKRGSGLRELTMAIRRFGEVYEKVESSKLQQAMEIEKQRLGFARELELQRMQFFMKTQMELSQLKRGKKGRRNGGGGQKRKLSGGGKAGGSGNHHQYNYIKNGSSNSAQ